MTVRFERHGRVALVTIDNPPVNALSQAVRQALIEAAEALDTDATVDAVVLTGAGRTFIAGADVNEFDMPPVPPHLPDVIARIEGAKKPWIAAINGAALGGGLEVALGCRFRLAGNDTRLGLPEITLGLVPGAGGTVRLPRLIGAQAAIEMVAGGKPIAAAKAAALGMLDEVVEDDVAARGLDFAREAIGRPMPPPLRDRPIPPVPQGFWEGAGMQVAQRAKGEVAPPKALACLQRAAECDFDTAMAFERQTFLELRRSEEAKALRHVVFAERAAGRPNEIAGIDPRPIRTTAVIGGGTMGAGIAAALRDANLPVTLVERDQASLAKGLANIRQIFEGAAKRGRISPEAARSRIDGVAGSTDYGALGATDLVIEAVFEDLAVKQAVFAELAAACRPDAVLATNTSYLDPAKIAQSIAGPARFLGLHFFSPANVMKLVEIVPTPATVPDVIAAGFALARRLGKIPVRAGICDGFIGNRILKTTREQAERALLAGASPAEVDAAMSAFGMPMGPCEAQDLGGLDIAAFQRAAARARGETPFAPVAERLCALGRYGQKTGGGWYDYASGDRTPRTSQVVAGIVAEEASKAGLERRSFTGGELADLIVMPMVNEAARILEEGIALRASDIDLVEIHGYGFPRTRGGLMHYAQSRGLGEVLEGVKSLHTGGLSRRPCELLVRSAATGRFAR
jgi:3-hydroxyacyl-CoA dehydrogenase